MQTVQEIMRWIRDWVNDPRHQQRLLSARFDWFRLCAAMDAIGDGDEAVGAYLAGEFPHDTGEKYLKVYGVLQVLFVQQDVLRHMIGVIRPAMRIELPDVLKEVRDVRNASIGHPTDFNRNGERSVHFISRATLGKGGFQMVSFNETNGTSFTSVPICALIEKQREEAMRILLEVVNQLKEEDRMHKEQFRESKLADSFRQVPYAFEKISADVRGDSQAVMGVWGVEHLQNSLSEFESSLKKRGMDLDTYDSVKYGYEQIGYPLGELSKFLNSQASDVSKRETAVVFVDALRQYFSNLTDIAEEIDLEYEESSGTR